MLVLTKFVDILEALLIEEWYFTAAPFVCFVFNQGGI
jgi:hypothetical protein